MIMDDKPNWRSCWEKPDVALRDYKKSYKNSAAIILLQRSKKAAPVP
jgi:hypothetical protein